MATLELTDEEVLALKAGIEYLNEDDQWIDSFAEAMGIVNSERKLTDEGEEKDDYSEGEDPAYVKFAELRLKILGL